MNIIDNGDDSPYGYFGMEFVLTPRKVQLEVDTVLPHPQVVLAVDIGRLHAVLVCPVEQDLQERGGERVVIFI